LSEPHRPVGGAIGALIVSFIHTGVVDEAIEELNIKAGESGARPRRRWLGLCSSQRAMCTRVLRADVSAPYHPATRSDRTTKDDRIAGQGILSLVSVAHFPNFGRGDEPLARIGSREVETGSHCEEKKKFDRLTKLARCRRTRSPADHQQHRLTEAWIPVPRIPQLQ